MKTTNGNHLELRNQAERLIRNRPASKKDETVLSDGALQDMIHEFELHQQELLLQTEELLRAQDQLKASRNEYIELYDYAPVGYLTINREGLIIRANLTAATMFGRKRAELLYRPLSAFVADESVIAYHHHRKIVTRSKDSYSCELTLKKNNGVDFCANFESVAVIDPIDQVTNWNTTINDISRRKKSEAVLSQMQKFESLVLMADGITHDFNNLLSVIMTNTSIASKKITVDNPAQKYLENILNAARNSVDLTRQMLTFAGQNKKKHLPLDLNVTAKANQKLLWAGLEAYSDLQLELETGLPLITADHAQISQIIVNLVMNASQAMRSNGGVIKIMTHSLKLQAEEGLHKQFTGELIKSGRYVTLTVEDNGSGIKPEHLAKIFDPFFTTKRTGSGLGLANVLGIMHSHQGAIWAESQVGVSTKFVLYFPVE